MVNLIKNINKTILFSLLAITMIGCTTNSITLSSQPQSIVNTQFVENLNNSVLIRFKNKISDNELQKLNNGFNIKSFKMLSDDLNIASIELNDNISKQKLKEKYQKSNLIKYVEDDEIINIPSYTVYPAEQQDSFSIKAQSYTPNDPLYSLQWNMKDVGVDKAWSITKGSPDIIIAVIDSGVDPTHPDLIDNLLPLIDVWNEFNDSDIFVSKKTVIDYTGKDGNGHGTHVTGIIGAKTDNLKGVAGVAGNVKILPIKATNYEGSTSASILTKSILIAIEKKAKIINMSIGGVKADGTQALIDAVNLAIDNNIVFVSAVGNESNRKSKIITDVTVPAAYSRVIAVAANTKFNKVANYSNGGEEVEITAPGGGSRSDEGEKIYSTWPTYSTYENIDNGIKNYSWFSGTSMACPLVSATVALILTREPNLTPEQIKIRLLATVTDIEQAGFDESTGYGKINVYNALTSKTHDLKTKE